MLFSDWAHFGIDCVRQNCGGAGYSAHSGLPQLFYDNSPCPVFEGDNTVLTLQASKFLVKLYKKAVLKNKQLDSPFDYLNKANELSRRICSAKDHKDFFDLNLLEEVL